MLTNPAQLAAAIARRLRFTAFGNNHSLLLNLKYAQYHRAATRSWRPPVPPSREAGDTASRFAREGWVVLPSTVDHKAAEAMGRRIDALFDSGDGVVKVSNGLLRLIDGVERFPEIAQFVSGFVAEVIESFFGSHFKIYSISFYRTVPHADAPDSSFLWHFDNVPDDEIKLMIYFDDVREDTGAFRFKTKELSQELRTRGFWHRKDYPKVSLQLEDLSSTICVEGGPGTTILFQNGRIAHKATAPRRSHRDIATLVIIPSLIDWREHFARNRHLLSTNAGVCKNPWTDEPENVGYRY